MNAKNFKKNSGQIRHFVASLPETKEISDVRHKHTEIFSYGENHLPWIELSDSEEEVIVHNATGGKSKYASLSEAWKNARTALEDFKKKAKEEKEKGKAEEAIAKKDKPSLTDVKEAIQEARKHGFKKYGLFCSEVPESAEDKITLKISQERKVLYWEFNFFPDQDVPYLTEVKKKNKEHLEETDESQPIAEQVKKVVKLFSDPKNFLIDDPFNDYLVKARNLNAASPDFDKDMLDLSHRYDEFTDEELSKHQEIKTAHKKLIEKYVISQEKTLQHSKHRNLYATKAFLDSLNSGRSLDIQTILMKMVTTPYPELMREFANRNGLVTLNRFKKIRIKNGSKHRLVFAFGKEVSSSRNPEDIYLYRYDEDHDENIFSDYLRRNPDDASYRLFRPYVTLDDNQRKIARYATSSYHPLLCVGCAGSGKTYISADMYQRIVSNEFLDNPPTDEELLYLTYNKVTLNNAKVLIKGLVNNVNAKSIDEFFLSVLNDKELEEKLIGEKAFQSFWEEGKSLSNDFQRRKKEESLMQKYDYRYAYTLFRGIYKGALPSWDRKEMQTRTLSSEDFTKTLKDEEEQMDIEEETLFYSLFEEYQNRMKEKSLVDDNDLATLAFQKAGEHPRYQRIIIDEVQDLTERQLESIIALSQDPNRLYFFGDQNQSINPTILDVKKIQGALLPYTSQGLLKPETMTKSYRFSRHIADYVNQLNRLRDEKIGTTSFSAIETPADQSVKLYAGYSLDEKLREDVLTRALKMTSSVILVPNENIKGELLKKLGKEHENFVLTVDDAKGSQWDYVVLYDMLSAQEKEVMEILNGKAKHSTLHRMVFNRYYVSITRAEKCFIVLEEKTLNPLIKHEVLSGLSQVKKKFLDLYFKENNDPSAWLRQGETYFAQEDYLQAKASFGNAVGLDTRKYQEWIERMLKPESWDLDFALTMKKEGHPQQALRIFKKLHREGDLLLLLSEEGEHVLTDEEIRKILKEAIITEDDQRHLVKVGEKFYLRELAKIHDMFKEMKGGQ